MAVAKVQALISENALVVFRCLSGDGSAIQAALAKLTRQRTVPNVFIAGQHMGGCDATTAIHKKGKLVPLLKDAGALKLVTM